MHKLAVDYVFNDTVITAAVDDVTAVCVVIAVRLVYKLLSVCVWTCVTDDFSQFTIVLSVYILCRAINKSVNREHVVMKYVLMDKTGPTGGKYIFMCILADLSRWTDTAGW